MLYIILFVTSIASLATYLAWRDWRTWYLLRRYGVEAKGSIKYMWKARLGHFPHYYLIYQFEGETPDGELFQHEKYTEIDVNHYLALEKGEPLMVVYAATNPAIFHLSFQTTEHLHWTFSAGFAWMCTAFFLFIALA
jgi:hypothetical protein